MTSQVKNMKNKVDGLVGENDDIRKEVEILKNEKMEQDQEHSYRVSLYLWRWFIIFIHNNVFLWR